jgi:uncharacterized membrane protein HdeD (DUF308 family)
MTVTEAKRARTWAIINATPNVIGILLVWTGLVTPQSPAWVCTTMFAFMLLAWSAIAIGYHWRVRRMMTQQVSS